MLAIISYIDATEWLLLNIAVYPWLYGVFEISIPRFMCSKKAHECRFGIRQLYTYGLLVPLGTSRSAFIIAVLASMTAFSIWYRYRPQFSTLMMVLAVARIASSRNIEKLSLVRCFILTAVHLRCFEGSISHGA